MFLHKDGEVSIRQQIIMLWRVRPQQICRAHGGGLDHFAMRLLLSAGRPPRRLVGKFPSGSLGIYIRIPESRRHGDEPAGFLGKHQKKHVMFQFSSKYSQQDPFPFLLGGEKKKKKRPNGNIQNGILCVGVARRGGAGYYQTKWSRALFWNVLSGV